MRLTCSRLADWLPVTLALLFTALFLHLLIAYPQYSGEIFSGDITAILTGPYRMANGDIPNQDFMSPLGFLYGAPAALIRYLSGMTIPIEHAFVDGLFGMSLLAAAAALWFTRGDRAWLMRSLLVVFAIAAAGSLLDVDTQPLLVYENDRPWSLARLADFGSMFFINYFGLHYAPVSIYGTYREFSAAFFGLAFFRWAYVPAASERRSALVEGILTGGLLTIMAYAKSTYCVFGLLFLLPATYGLIPETRAIQRIGVATFALLSLLLELFYHHVVSGYAHDILLMLKMKARPITWLHLTYLTVTPILALLLAIIGLYFFLTRHEPRQSYPRRLAWLSLAWIPVYYGINSYDVGEAGRLLCLAPLFMVAFGVLERSLYGPRQNEAGLAANRWAVIACLLLMALPILSVAISQGFTLVKTPLYFDGVFSAANIHRMKDTTSVPAPLGAVAVNAYMKDCVAQGGKVTTCWRASQQPDPSAPTLLQVLDDGNAMLARNGADNLLVFDSIDPYSIMLGRRQAPHIPTWFAHETFTPACYERGDELLAGADYVLVPHYPYTINFQNEMLRLYGNDLRRLYDVIDEDDQFTLYKQRAHPLVQPRRYHCDMGE